LDAAIDFEDDRVAASHQEPVGSSYLGMGYFLP
jgi:hypothetical protein